jgi:hypothetical protein
MQRGLNSGHVYILHTLFDIKFDNFGCNIVNITMFILSVDGQIWDIGQICYYEQSNVMSKIAA